MRTHADFVKLNTFLAAAFHTSISNDPLWFERNAPDRAMIYMAIDGDDEFNEWSKALAEANCRPGFELCRIEFKAKR